MSRILFLDVDGVLNRCGKSNQGLEADKCDLLADLCRRSGCKVVVSSTWRRYPHLMEDRLLPMFRSRGIECVGQTPMLERPNPGGHVVVAAARHEEITAWLAEHPEVTQYAIVDDDRDADDGTGRYVRTDSYEGMTESHAAKIERILTTHPPRPPDGPITGQEAFNLCKAAGVPMAIKQDGNRLVETTASPVAVMRVDGEVAIGIRADKGP